MRVYAITAYVYHDGKLTGEAKHIISVNNNIVEAKKAFIKTNKNLSCKCVVREIPMVEGSYSLDQNANVQGRQWEYWFIRND